MAELKKILYVEDEPDIQEVAIEAMTALGGFEIKACSNGKEALAACAGFGPDLILMDVMMPEMDGPTTLKSLKADGATSSIPVIFMTAKVQSHEVEEYKKQGVVDVIKKPFDVMTLSDQIKDIWAKSGN